MRLSATAIPMAVCCATALAVQSSASAAVPRLPAANVVHAAAAAPPRVVLRRVERAFEKPAPPGSKPDLSPLMRRLALALPRLHGADHSRAERLLARPSQGSADPEGSGWTVPEAANSPLCSAHYCVHWVASGSDAPLLADSNHNDIPDWVETDATRSGAG